MHSGGVKSTPVKVGILVQLLYSSKGKKVRALKCTHHKKVSLWRTSTSYFYEKLTEPCNLKILLSDVNTNFSITF